MKFQEQAAKFLQQARNRRRDPICEHTATKYELCLNRHIIPVLGDIELQHIKNAALKLVVDRMAAYSASLVQTAIFLVKAVVSSAVDGEGNELYPQKWNAEFVDAPQVVPAEQKAPMAPAEAIQQALGTTKGQDKALIALLAGTGLRIDEALNLTLGDWDILNMTISVKKSKTDAGVRVIDLAPELNRFLVSSLDKQTGIDGYLFGSTYLTAYRHLKSAGLPPPHSLRRFRVTRLQKMGTPRGLVQGWIGHAKEDVTDRYDKIMEDEAARKEWAKRVGLGFLLEEVS